jgi:hypothetical protein
MVKQPQWRRPQINFNRFISAIKQTGKACFQPLENLFEYSIAEEILHFAPSAVQSFTGPFFGGVRFGGRTASHCETKRTRSYGLADDRLFSPKQ